MSKLISQPVSNFNAQFLKQDGVTVRGQRVVSASNGKVRLADGRHISAKGERAFFDSSIDGSMLSSGSGDTEGDNL